MYINKIENIRNIFGSLGYLSRVINKNIVKPISKMNRPLEQGPKNCPVYLRYPYLGKQANFMESKVKDTFGAMNLTIAHSTRKPLNGIYKDFTPDPGKNNIIYKFKRHCDSVYIGKTSQRL